MLSTTPACVEGRLVPRPMSLRVFLARTPVGLGGHAGRLRPHRQRARAERHRHAARRHRRRRLVRQPAPGRDRLDAARRRRRPTPASAPGVLPSRAADNLFWLGRYVERAEGAMRLVRAYHVRLAETPDREAPLNAWLGDYLDSLGLTPGGADPVGADRDARQRHHQRRQRPRPLLDGRLGRRSTTSPRPPAASSERVDPRRRRGPGDERAPAQDHRLLGPRPREHVPLHRLAVPVDRPLARAGDRHVGRARRPRRPRGARGRARPRRRGRRQRHVPPPALLGDDDAARPSSTFSPSTPSTRARSSTTSTEIRGHIAFLPERRGQRADVAPRARGAAAPHRPRRRDARHRRRRGPRRADRRRSRALSNLLSDTYLR